MTVGIVAIGRNEGDRLRRCLQTLDLGVPVVYVDSASTDGSLEELVKHPPPADDATEDAP